MAAIEGIFSIRLVIADFYMEKPIYGFDPCYSELRGKEIKRVPIIRIFGPNASGQKTCMHVHGVFPYFYIPYEKRDFESVERGILQIATHLDKAINISLGQGSSEAQHVFKIQLVKGIPFYGYHRNEHQFLKIYMFNPRFVRRAANLLQNGAILNKNFNPHESHVPYILQFMIDYNLYGMSFLHIPAEIVKFRRSTDEEEIPYPNVLNTQVLCTLTTKKVSCSTLETDISSNFILNRFQLLNKRKTTHTNPGIEAIWHDEQIRRQKLAQSYNGDEEKLNALPVLEVPATQERPNVEIAESEVFFRTALISKLLVMENSTLTANNSCLADQTINATLPTNSSNMTMDMTAPNAREQRRTFNLQKILANSVYPDECTQQDQLVNASHIENHLGNNNVFQNGNLQASQENRNEQMRPANLNESVFLDDTLVDEQLVLSLTQPHVALDATLREEDLQLLDALQQLEEHGAEENQIDLDSSLAPLSQQHKHFELTPSQLDKEIAAAATNKPISDSDSESDNETIDNLNDYSIAMDDIDELLLKLTQSQPKKEEPKSELKVPQIDGTDDLLLRTPKKSTTRNSRQITSPRTPSIASKLRKNLAMTSPLRSPRTPKSNVAAKYAPLPFIFTSNSAEKTNILTDSTTPVKSPIRLDGAPKAKTLSLSKKLAMTEMRRKSICTEGTLQATRQKDATNSSKIRAVKTPIRLRRATINLDVTHITCELRPRRKSERLLKVFTPGKDETSSSEIDRTARRSNINSSIEQQSKQRVVATHAENIENCKKLKKVKVLLKDINAVNLKKNYANTPKVSQIATEVPKRRSRRFLEAENSAVVLENNKRMLRSKTEQNLHSPLLTSKPAKEIKVTDLRSSRQRRRSAVQDGDVNIKSAVELPNNERRLRSTSRETSSSKSRKSGGLALVDAEMSTAKQRKRIFPTVKNQKDLQTFGLQKLHSSTSGESAAINSSFTVVAELKEVNEKQKSVESVGDTAPEHDQEAPSFVEVSGVAAHVELVLAHEHVSGATDEVVVPVEAAAATPRVASDDEIIASDTESDVSDIKLRKTPNLRRLRRSFRESIFAKRLKMSEVAKHKVIAASTAELSVEQLPRTPIRNLPATSQHKSATLPPPNDMQTPICTPRVGRNQRMTSPHNEDSPSLMQSFYEHSILVDSPSIFSDDSASPTTSIPARSPTNTVGSSSQHSVNFLKSASHTPISHRSLPKLSGSNEEEAVTEDTVIVTPLELPPDYNEVLEGCRKFNIHEYEFQAPHYSNPDDITKMKEVGFMVLQIPGNKLNDCEEFQSLLSGDGHVGLNAWRRKQLIALGGPAMLNRYRNAAQICEYFADSTRIVIEPQQSAPSRQDAKLWLKARELLQQKEQDLANPLDIDSPIKIRRQKVTMMLNEDGGGGDDDEDMDCSTCSLSLTPMTPACKTAQHKPRDNETDTPLTSNDSITKSLISKSSNRQRSKGRAKLSLNAKLQAAQSDKIKCIPSENLMATQVDSSQEINKSSQTSDSSISSQLALAELERSSFVRQLQNGGDQPQSHEISFGLACATLDNTYGFKVNLENLQAAKADIEYNYLTTMMLELFVRTREDLHPDPLHDEIRCMFYAIEHSIPAMNDDGGALPHKQLPTKACGYIIVNDQQDFIKEGRIHGIDADIEVQVVTSEAAAFEALLALCARWDPDMFAGYEIEMGSWGYVIERAKYLCLNIAPLLSRVPTQKMRDFVDEDRDQFTDIDIEMKICGRILLDVWRLMRSEIALTSYTFENVMYHILHKRCPWHNYRRLTEWFTSPCSRWIVIEYYLERVRGTMALLDQLDLIGRTSEMAKLIGIQFYEVLSRGSQFRVESMMLRIAKPKNLVPLSPSVQQRAHMRAPEYLALIMEPESRFYADPVIVLDFQSLYPSMIIAYNYCFSTCLGRVEHLGQTSAFEFGASHLRVSPTMLKKLLDRDLVTISPCGVVFVKSSVREGMLPRMLTEILDTRQMVKQSMKLHKSNTALQRILHSRQLGLKLMANVTYGYTAANFSGRMPSVEVGDTVVSKGRETLERAIRLVETNDNWNVRVVYGDTDSMFVLVPGRNRAQAFKIGEEIAEAVTKLNPHPVKLKLEKVYQPCILQTKKRYVGYMYETPDQAEPVYEAKGIETVRRDGCPAVAKMLEKVLRILFATADVSQVKQYVCRQFTKLLSGRANLQDLIFAKEFRGLNGYRPTACVPALELTRKWLQTDPRHIPRRGERVPFIIVNGPPGVPLIRLVRSPHELLADPGYKINAIYYITKAIIPPLNRCLLLIGADVNDWFANLPRKILLTPALSTGNELINTKANSNQLKKSTISQYFSTTNCIIDCGRQTKQGICSACAPDAMKCAVTLQMKIANYERSYHLTQQICQACCGRIGDINCSSLDCPVLYVLEVKRRDLQQVGYIRKLLEERVFDERTRPVHKIPKQI